MSNFIAQENALFLQGLKTCFGYDFQHYVSDYLTRRLDKLRHEHESGSLLVILDEMLKDARPVSTVIDNLTIGTTEFFRDPDTYLVLKKQVLPALANHTTLNIWSAGCSNGKELLSLLILLQEQSLLARSTVYATDLNSQALECARKSTYSKDEIREYTQRYMKVSAKHRASDYYTFDFDHGYFDKALFKNVIFVEHDLLGDSVLETFDLILCRNVLIYSNDTAQRKALSLLTSSLDYSGYLVLGQSESLYGKYSDLQMKIVNSERKIYQRSLHRN